MKAMNRLAEKRFRAKTNTTSWKYFCGLIPRTSATGSCASNFVLGCEVILRGVEKAALIHFTQKRAAGPPQAFPKSHAMNSQAHFTDAAENHACQEKDQTRESGNDR